MIGLASLFTVAIRKLLSDCIESFLNLGAGVLHHGYSLWRSTTGYGVGSESLRCFTLHVQ